jgi:hypothetical protein
MKPAAYDKTIKKGPVSTGPERCSPGSRLDYFFGLGFNKGSPVFLFSMIE